MASRAWIWVLIASVPATAVDRGRARSTAGLAPVVGSPPAEVARFPWGAGPYQLGRAEASESSPECLAAFSVDARGSVTVLDQLNSRLVTHDDLGTRSVDVGGTNFIDLEPTASGGWALLDGKRGAISFVDASGSPRALVSALGEHAPKPGGLTALARSVEGFWVEYDRENAILVAGPDGTRVEHGAVASGKPALRSKDRVRARLDLSTRQTVSVELWRGEATTPVAIDVAFPLRVWNIAALDADDTQLVLAVRTLPPHGLAPGTPGEMQVVSYGLDGRERWRRRWTPNDRADLQHRPVRLGQDGAVYVLTCEPDAAVLRRLP